MHLLAATAGVVSDGSEAADLGQTSGDIVFLSAADTELAALAAAQTRAGKNAPTLRLANFLKLKHHYKIMVQSLILCLKMNQLILATHSFPQVFAEN